MFDVIVFCLFVFTFLLFIVFFFFFSSRRRHTRFDCDWSSDVCSSDLADSSAVPFQRTTADESARPFLRARVCRIAGVDAAVSEGRSSLRLRREAEGRDRKSVV